MRVVFLGSGEFGLPTLEAIAAKHVYPDHTGSDSRGTSFSRTFELMPSEPMRRSHCTLEPLLSRPVTLLPGAEYWCFVYPVT